MRGARKTPQVVHRLAPEPLHDRRTAGPPPPGPETGSETRRFPMRQSPSSLVMTLPAQPGEAAGPWQTYDTSAGE